MNDVSKADLFGRPNAAPEVVTLTEREFIHAYSGGCGRRAYARFNRLRAQLGEHESADKGLHADAEAACAELAAGKYLGLEWKPRVGRFGPGDLAGVEVKSSLAPRSCVWFRPKDPDALPFVYVTGQDGTYQLHGWIAGRDGKRLGAWQGEPENGMPPAWKFPRAALRDIRELRELVAGGHAIAAE